MDHRNFNNTFYIRMDRGDEMLGICLKEHIRSAIFSGISDPETGAGFRNF